MPPAERPLHRSTMADRRVDVLLLQAPIRHRVQRVAVLHSPPPVLVHASAGDEADGRHVELVGALWQIRVPVACFKEPWDVPTSPGGAGVHRRESALRFQTAVRLRFSANRPDLGCRQHAFLR